MREALVCKKLKQKLVPVRPKEITAACCGNFLAELGQALVKASCKLELPSRRLVVPRGNVSPPCAKQHTYTAFSRLNFLHRQIRPNRSILLNFGIIPGSFGLFYTLIEFLGI